MTGSTSRGKMKHMEEPPTVEIQAIGPKMIEAAKEENQAIYDELVAELGYDPLVRD